MRKDREPTPEMQRAYDEAHADYQLRLAAYNSQSWWKRFRSVRPVWSAIQPGYYTIFVTHYIDGTFHDKPNALGGSWCWFRDEHVDVNDYSPEWYARQAQRREQMEFEMQRSMERQRYEMQLAQENIWRANVGNAYYDLKEPWAWQSRNYW